jgi:hypothetical protein
MDFLLERFEDGKLQYATDDFMSLCCNAGWNKLTKYYGLTERSPAYVAALVLSPQEKWDYLNRYWEEDWCIQAKLDVQEFWESKYKVYNSDITSQEAGERRPLKNDFLVWRALHKGPVVTKDEYEVYLSTPPVYVEDARAWWQEPTQQSMYPNLSKMALDVLSIPAMSAEPERLFSSCKITITDRRNQLGIEAIEAIECLKSWMGRDNIPYIDELDGMVIVPPTA